MTASDDPTPTAPPVSPVPPLRPKVQPKPLAPITDPDLYQCSVALATISGADVCMELTQQLWEIKNHTTPVRIDGWIPQPSGPYLDDGRNATVQSFRREFPNTDWLLCVDSDIWHPDLYSQIVLLLRTGMYLGAQLIGGSYLGHYHGNISTIAARWVNRPDGIAELVNVTKEEVETHDDTVPVDVIGTGFLAIHSTLLERMAHTFAPPQVWFDEPVWHYGGQDVHFGEDWAFCLKATELGIRPLLHRGVRLIHKKTIGLTYTA